MTLLLLCALGTFPAAAEDQVDPKSLPISSATTPAEPGPFSVKFDPFIVVPAGKTVDVRFTLTVPAHTKIYKDQVSVEVLDAAGMTVGTVELPAGESFEDPYGGGLREAYAVDTQFALPLVAPSRKAGRVDMSVRVSWQGCGDGMCYMPSSRTFNVPIRVTKGS